MCQAASFVVTKDRVFWSKKTDSHEKIIREFSLVPEVAGKICIVRCEVVPPEFERYDLPADKWVYRTDQNGDMLPEWFDDAEVEARCRVALNEWIKTRVFVDCSVEIRDVLAFVFSSVVTARDSSVVTAFDSSVVEAFGSSVVTARDSSVVTACDFSVVEAFNSSKVDAFGSSVVTARNSSVVTACDSSVVES